MRLMPAFPCGLILTSLAWASPALAQEPAKLAVPTELPRLEVVDQVPFLLWGEHTVLRCRRAMQSGRWQHGVQGPSCPTGGACRGAFAMDD